MNTGRHQRWLRQLPPHAARALGAWGLVIDARASERLQPSRHLTLACRANNLRFLLKVASSPREAALAHEAGALRWLARSASTSLAPRLARARPGVLALHWESGRTLFELRHGSGDEGHRRTGAALGELHRLAGGSRRHTAAPLVETLAEGVTRATPVEREVWRLLRRSPRLARSWRQALAGGDDTFIHGDFRYANVLIAPRRVTVVDWEASGRGTAWRDVGSFLAEALSTFIAPRAVDDTISLERLRRRSASFLRGYFGARPELGLEARRDAGAVAMAWAAEAVLRAVVDAGVAAPGLDADGRRLVDWALTVGHAPSQWADHFWSWSTVASSSQSTQRGERRGLGST